MILYAITLHTHKKEAIFNHFYQLCSGFADPNSNFAAKLLIFIEL